MVPPNRFDEESAGVTIKAAAMRLDYRCKAGGKQVYNVAAPKYSAAAGWDRGVPSFDAQMP